MDSMETFLDVGCLGQGHDLWPLGMDDFFDFNAGQASTVTGIEDTYAAIHKSIDQAYWNISRQKNSTLEQVRQQNRKVVNKLAGLEEEVVRRTPTPSRADSIISEARSSISSAASNASLRRISQAQSTLYDSPTLAARRLQSITSIPEASYATPISITPSPRPNQSARSPSNSSSGSHDSTQHLMKRRRICPSTDKRTPSKNNAAERASSVVTTNASEKAPEMARSHRLAQKMLQIGNADSVARLDEFQQQLQIPHSRLGSSTLTPSYGFPSLSTVGNGTEFLQMLPNLAMAIECNIFGEQNHRIHKRVALAHFFQAYTIAQENPETFLSWCNDHHPRSSLLPKGGYKSIVQHRFADLMFPHRTLPNQSSRPEKNDGLKAQIGKIQTWRKNGKQWAKMILRFGYGVLLLVPQSLTDEDLRVAHDEDIAYILDKLEERRYLFSTALERANELLRCHFFPEQAQQQPIDVAGCDDLDWNEFFQSIR